MNNLGKFRIDEWTYFITARPDKHIHLLYFFLPLTLEFNGWLHIFGRSK